MKKLLYFLLLMMPITPALAQPADTLEGWAVGGETHLNFSQASFHNWAAGGENTVSLTALLNLYINEQKDRHTWENNIRVQYGKIKSGKTISKSDDLLELDSKYRRFLSDDWSLAIFGNIRTQMDKGYVYPNDSTPVSKFLSPAYATFGIGFDYQPTSSLSLMISPLTAKVTYIDDTTVAKPALHGLEPGNKVKFDLGALAALAFKKEIMENVTLDTRLSLFSNYLDNPQNIDILWDMLISMKINKYLTASINTQLIYDDDIRVPKEKMINGAETIYYGKGTQFKEVLAIGFSYKF